MKFDCNLLLPTSSIMQVAIDALHLQQMVKITVSIQVIGHKESVDGVQTFVVSRILLLYPIAIHKTLAFYKFSGYRVRYFT